MYPTEFLKPECPKCGPDHIGYVSWESWKGEGNWHCNKCGRRIK